MTKFLSIKYSCRENTKSYIYTMHAVQGALAVRRERQKRLQRSYSKRKHGSNSDGSRRPSEDVESGPVKGHTKEGTSMTSFYIGVFFILIGFLLIFSSMVPANIVNADWSRLLGVGIAFLLIGLLMVMVNRILSAQEDEELKSYVSSRLARSKSGHVLCRSRNPSLDVTKLAPPGGPPSRRGSYRDRPGSTRSINRSPSLRQTAGTEKAIERSSSVRKSIKKPSPSQSVSSTSGLAGLSNISRSNSQRVKCNPDSIVKSNHGAPASIKKSSTKEEFRSRSSSVKLGNIPTVLVQVTDDSNNSSSLILLGPGADSMSKNRYTFISL